MSKPTYYRHRKELMQHGINIDITHCGPETTNVMPMFRFLEAVPANIPTWAFDKGLIHHSARQQG